MYHKKLSHYIEMKNSRPTGENQSLKEALEKQLHTSYKT